MTAQITVAELRGHRAERTASCRERVAAARSLQAARQGVPNAQLRGYALLQMAVLDAVTGDMLERTAESTKMVSRDIINAVRTARTIADLDGLDRIARVHMAEALIYSPKRYLDQVSHDTATV